jgi:hypothetical protein
MYFIGTKATNGLPYFGHLPFTPIGPGEVKVDLANFDLK